MKGNRQSIRYWLFPFIITYLERMNKELTSYDKIATVLFKGHEETIDDAAWHLCGNEISSL